MKRFCSFLLIACLMLGMLPTVHAADIIASGDCGSDMEWSLSSDYTLTISGTGRMYDYSGNEAPWDQYSTSIYYLIIEDGVEVIGSGAFDSCSYLMSAELPPSIQECEYNAFDECTNLKSVYITDLAAWCNISYANSWAHPLSARGGELFFNEESLIDVVIPDGVERLHYTFYGVSGLRSAIVPASVTYVGHDPFGGAQFIEYVVFQGDAPEFADYAFQSLSPIVLYPAGNDTWTEDKFQNYRGYDVEWVSYEPVDDFGFILHPAEQYVYEGATGVFEVIAFGEDVSYQWQKTAPGSNSWENLSIDGANTRKITVTMTQERNGEKYRCVATDKNGKTIYSNEATFTLDTTTAYNYTVKLVDDTFRYLDEIYIDKYPELGLRFTYGGPDEERVLTDLVLAITEGCTTSREKADAINAWVQRNIDTVDTCPFPIETFYARGGVCLGQAILMSTLFRLAGIPATWGDGWRGNTQTLTPQDFFDLETGHAWCFAYVDGEWELYDPLWSAVAFTDKDQIARTFYFNMVEGITPVYDTDELPPYEYVEPNWYIDGRFYANQNYIINYSVWLNMLAYYPNQGYRYMDPAKDTSGMVEGEAYRDGWLGPDYRHYLYENGVAAAGVIREENGKQYYFTSQNGMVFEILCDQDDYSIINGFFTVKPGYKGMPLDTAKNTDGQTVIWESDSPAVSVDEDGVITANYPGAAQITAHFYRNSDGVYLGSGCTYQLHVSELERIPDYSDSYTDHEHQYTPILRKATAYNDAYILYTCTVGDCAHSHTAPGTTPVNTHTVTTEIIPPTCQEVGYIVYICSCGNRRMEKNAEKADHTWGEWKTDTSTGETIRKCIHCDAQEIQGVLAKGTCGEHLTWTLSATGVLTISGTGEMYDYILYDAPWRSYNSVLREVVVKNGVTSIGNFAFYQSLIEKIELPNTIKRIGTYAFAFTESLGRIIIPASVNSIESSAFTDTLGLCEIHFGGNPPFFGRNGTNYDVFQNVTATVYTREGTTWSEKLRTSLGDGLTWKVFPFKDVSTDNHFYLPVIWAVENGITNGTTPTTFSPNSPCTRWQIVTFLWRAAGCPEPSSMAHNFKDIAPDSFYLKAVLWAVENGITNGTTATTFSPNDICSRWQIVTFLWRYAGCPEPTATTHSFTDIAPGSFYLKAVLWAVEEGITNGTTPTTFAPNNPCTRGQIVTFLYRYLVE